MAANLSTPGLNRGLSSNFYQLRRARRMLCVWRSMFKSKMFINGLDMDWPLQIEQRSFIKYLLVVKCKPYEIYRRMCDVYGEACFSQNMFTNGLNMGWPLQIEQRSFIKYLLVVKCKPCEIYRRMFYVYGEACFSQKMFTNGLNMGWPLQMEQRSFIKYLLVVKCKPCEISEECVMCMEKHVLVKICLQMS